MVVGGKMTRTWVAVVVALTGDAVGTAIVAVLAVTGSAAVKEGVAGKAVGGSTTTGTTDAELGGGVVTGPVVKLVAVRGVGCRPD